MTATHGAQCTAQHDIIITQPSDVAFDFHAADITPPYHDYRAIYYFAEAALLAADMQGHQHDSRFISQRRRCNKHPFKFAAPHYIQVGHRLRSRARARAIIYISVISLRHACLSRVLKGHDIAF